MRVAGRVPDGYMRTPKPWWNMRAETQNLVEDIKRSIGLLRRHL
jgi:hypothetical protein